MISFAIIGFARADACVQPLYELSVEAAATLAILPGSTSPGGFVGVEARWRALTAELNLGSSWIDVMSLRVGVVGTRGPARVAAGVGYSYNNLAGPESSLFGWLRVSVGHRFQNGYTDVQYDFGAAFFQDEETHLRTGTSVGAQVTSAWKGLGARAIGLVQDGPGWGNSVVRIGALYTFGPPGVCEGGARPRKLDESGTPAVIPAAAAPDAGGGEMRVALDLDTIAVGAGVDP